METDLLNKLQEQLYTFYSGILILQMLIEGSDKYYDEESQMFEGIDGILDSIDSINSIHTGKIKNISKLYKSRNAYNAFKNNARMNMSIPELLVDIQGTKELLYGTTYGLMKLNVNKPIMTYIRDIVIGQYFFQILDAINKNEIKKIHSYKDLLEYNKRFFDGKLPCTFYYYNRLIPDQSDDTLQQLADKGFFTVDGQGNVVDDEGVYQREYSDGFIQEKNVDKLKKCVEKNPHLFGYITDIHRNKILDKRNTDMKLPDGSIDEDYSVTVIKDGETFEMHSGIQSTFEEFVNAIFDKDGWWHDFKKFKHREGKIHEDIEHLYFYKIFDDRWIKEDTDDSLLKLLLKCVSSSGIVSSGGKRKTRKARLKRRKTYKKLK